MLKIYFVFALVLSFVTVAAAQIKQTNSKPKTETVQVSNLAGNDIGFECKKLSTLFIGTIFSTSIPQNSKAVSNIELRMAKGKRTFINFDETKTESLSENDSRKLSSLLVKGKKVELRVVQCDMGSGPVFYADSIRNL